MKLSIPDRLDELTLEQIQRIWQISQNPDISDFPKMVHAVAVFIDRRPAEIALVEFRDLLKIYDSMIQLLNNTQPAPLKRFIKIQGREFAFVEDIRDMETGAFIDADQLSKAEDFGLNLHKIMAILYREIDARIGDGYRLKSYAKERQRVKEQRQALFLKYMTYDVVRGATSFFLIGAQRSTNIYNRLSQLIPVQVPAV